MEDRRDQLRIGSAKLGPVSTLCRALRCGRSAWARSDASRDLFEQLARTWTLLAKDIDDAQDFERETRKLLENNEGVAGTLGAGPTGASEPGVSGQGGERQA